MILRVIVSAFFFAMFVPYSFADDAMAARLTPIVELTMKHGTNKPVSAASAKILGLSDTILPAIQIGVLPPGEKMYHGFGISLRNTNDLFFATIDKDTRIGTVWLTSPSGEIRMTISTATNRPPEVLTNELHAEAFVNEVEFWMMMATPEPTNENKLSGDGEQYGEEGRDASAMVYEISEKFGHTELKKLYDLLNSTAFLVTLTNYTCGDPAPKLAFTVWLRPSGYATTRAVQIAHSPGASPSGRTRGLMFGIDFLVEKAVASIDPDPQEESTREPKCDCSKRDSNGEWVEFPGPDIILAPKKAAAALALQKASEAEQEKEQSLGTLHLTPDGASMATNGERLVTREKVLGTLPAKDAMSLFVIDPTFSHWAYAIKRDGKQAVVLDGVAGKAYDSIPDHQEFEFSRDGKHFAYIAKNGGKMFVVADGKEGKAYDDIEEMFHPIFSADGKHLAYIASKSVMGFAPPKSFVVLDGVEQKSYELVEAIQFSRDGKHLAYDAEPSWNNGALIVSDGKESKNYDGTSESVFSPDGNRFAFVADRRSKSDDNTVRFAVVDGQEEPAYKSVSFVRFSPDGKHVAYTAHKEATLSILLVRDGVETKYANIGSRTFSPDSAHLAYTALLGTNWLALIDGKKLEPQAQNIYNTSSFSPLSDFVFSPDSQHLTYIARGGDTNWSVMLDGKTIAVCEGIALSPDFSPDGKNLAYATRRGEKSIPVFGGHEGNTYDEIITWQTPLEEGSQTIGFRFDDAGVLHLLAIRDRKIIQVELELSKD